ncbi:MAG: hypothetical protein ACYSWU_15165 [Planctomycetota bacterium]
MKAAFLVLATALLLFAACGGGGGSHPTAGEWAGHWLGEYVAPVAPEGPEEGELFATISDGWIWIGLQPDGANFHWQISDLQIAERSDERLVLRTGEVEVVFHRDQSWADAIVTIEEPGWFSATGHAVWQRAYDGGDL